MQKLFKKNYNKIGILGGTFDPPHKGHLYISKIALKKLKLNKLIWVVTKKNPLKQKPYLSTKARINLSKEITKKEKKIFVRYFDDKIKSINTFDLLNFIKKKNQNAKLFFLIGGYSRITSSIHFFIFSSSAWARLPPPLGIRSPNCEFPTIF